MNVNKKHRPVNLNLLAMRFPATAIASITHRLSGLFIFAALAPLLYLLSLSLKSADDFAYVQGLIHSFAGRVLLWFVLSILCFHAIGGCRHLLMDMGCFEDLENARRSVKFAFLLSVLGAIAMGGLLW